MVDRRDLSTRISGSETGWRTFKFAFGVVAEVVGDDGHGSSPVAIPSASSLSRPIVASLLHNCQLDSVSRSEVKELADFISLLIFLQLSSLSLAISALYVSRCEHSRAGSKIPVNGRESLERGDVQARRSALNRDRQLPKAIGLLRAWNQLDEVLERRRVAGLGR